MKTREEFITEYEAVIKAYEWYDALPPAPIRSAQKCVENIFETIYEDEWNLYTQMTQFGILPWDTLTNEEQDKNTEVMNEMSGNPAKMRKWLAEVLRK